MIVNGIRIDDTFAEAFEMRATRLIITADRLPWAYNAANSMTGFATSVIGCGCEAAIEKEVAPSESPDGRPGVAVLVFAMSLKDLDKQIVNRTGQSVMTSPGSACFAGLDGDETVRVGNGLRYFGDGYQTSKRIGDRRFWRIPVMDGEFLCQDTSGAVRAVGGGNFLILAASRDQCLAAAEHAVTAIRQLPNVILPFPGGIVRSGSKIGSKYPFLIASTNTAYCPTIRGQGDSAVEPDVESVLEIVIDGLSADDVANAMRVGIKAVCEAGQKSGVRRISAGNYGGKLGKFHFHLAELLT